MLSINRNKKIDVFLKLVIHMEKYYEANKKLWDEFAKINFKAESYQVDKFLAGKTTLKPIELSEMGSVKGKKLLHLQCHFGLDTLSWAREGAKVTGVDFSTEGIRLAKFLANEIKIDARFIQSNIYELQKVLNDQFDIVYTSFGVLCWLHDLKKWAKIIAHFLKPKGIFYMAEFHPFAQVFDDENKSELQLKYNYFYTANPMEFTADGSYADSNMKIAPIKEYEWTHSLSEIVNSIINAGLEIQFLNEYPFTAFQHFPFLIKDSEGYWRWHNQKVELPLTFTLKAIKK